MQKHLRTILLFTAFLLALSAHAQRSKQDSKLLISRIFYFTSNIIWPESNEPFRIGYFVEDTDLKPEFDRLSRRKIQKRIVKIIPLQNIQDVSKYKLDVLYANPKRSRKLKDLKQLTEGTNCLIVSDNATAKREVFINMIPYRNTLGFEVHKGNVHSRGMKVGANLLIIGGKEVDVRELYIESAKSLRSEKEKVEKQSKLIAKQERDLNQQKAQLAAQRKNIQLQQEQIKEQNEELAQQQKRLELQRAELNELLESTQEQEKQFLLKQVELEEKATEVSKQQAMIEKNSKILEGLRKDSKALQAQNAKQKKSLKQKDVEIDSQETTILYSFIFLAITATLVILAVVAYIGKRRANEKLRLQKETIEQQNAEIQQRNEEVMAQRDELASQNAEIQQQKEEIESQKDELLRQKEIVENQNFMITGSIRYAQTIQQAMLPPQSSLDAAFNNFVLFMPKDIVSGDFYWYGQNETNGIMSHYFAVVDCTGHGVPGAFMSMIGSRVLNMLVNERNLTDPADILEGMDIAVQKSLRQEQTDNRDGMEVCLIKVTDVDGKRNVEFSGARRPLYVYQQSGKEIIKFVGNVRGIAGPLKKSKRIAFSTAKINIAKGDVMYLTSDGFKDQNNRERRRFGTPSMMRLIQNIGHMEMDEQLSTLEEVLTNHMEGAEQRDDITLAGIRV